MHTDAYRFVLVLDGVSHREVQIRASCECANVLITRREDRKHGAFIEGIFRVEPTKLEPNIEPGIWVDAEDGRLSLFTPPRHSRP